MLRSSETTFFPGSQRSRKWQRSSLHTVAATGAAPLFRLPSPRPRRWLENTILEISRGRLSGGDGCRWKGPASKPAKGRDKFSKVQHSEKIFRETETDTIKRTSRSLLTGAGRPKAARFFHRHAWLGLSFYQTFPSNIFKRCKGEKMKKKK